MGIENEVKDVNDAEIRRRAVDRVIDVGGEVLGVTVHDGAVRLRGRVGAREDIPLLERLLREIDGATDVDAQFAVGGERSPEPTRG